MADNKDQDPVASTEAAEKEEQEPAEQEQEGNENQSAKVVEGDDQATAEGDGDAEASGADEDTEQVTDSAETEGKKEDEGETPENVVTETEIEEETEQALEAKNEGQVSQSADDDSGQNEEKKKTEEEQSQSPVQEEVTGDVDETQEEVTEDVETQEEEEEETQEQAAETEQNGLDQDDEKAVSPVGGEQEEEREQEEEEQEAEAQPKTEEEVNMREEAEEEKEEEEEVEQEEQDVEETQQSQQEEDAQEDQQAVDDGDVKEEAEEVEEDQQQEAFDGEQHEDEGEEQVVAETQEQEEETPVTADKDNDDKEEEGEQTTEDDTGENTEATPGGDDQEGDEEDQGEEKDAAGEEGEATEQQQEEETEQAQTEGGPEMEKEDTQGEQELEQAEGMAAMAAEPSDLNENAPGSTSGEASVPPAPHLPSHERSYTNIEGQMSTSALNIVWSFGLNRNVPVLNLSDGVRQAIMYPCAHVGIMYDFKNNKQHILQAHLNPITCSAVSHDKRWLVTGDVGPDAMVNIWDTYTGTPIQTMFDPNPQGGVVAVALTPDSRYLATLSALPVQTLAIWDWTVDGDVPICSADLKPEFGVQNYICFDATDIHHLVTNSETQVLFYHWEDNAIRYYAPPLTDSDFNKPVGRYSQSLFQVGIARALTATSIGNLVVWDNNRPLSKIMDVNQSADKKPLKIIKVHDKGISVLTTTDSYIVIGDTAGHVKFFDQGLRLIYWYQDIHSGPCTAISFAHLPEFVPIPSDGSKYPSDATKAGKPFVVRDFIVGTSIAVYCSVHTDGSQLKIIHREHDAAVHALAAHPCLPIIAIGSYSGLLKLWDYRNKEVVASRMFEKSHIQSIAFDPKGFNIAVGFTNGTVYLVDSVALLNQLSDPFKYARDAITHIAFAHNSSYFATADAGFTITLYKRQRIKGRNPYTWHGRYRSHYKPIRDLLFDIHLDTGEPKLLSLGEDRMLIEYDLNHVGKSNNHMVPCAQDRIEQGAIPQCMTKYPPITQEHFFLTANDQYKLKCYNSTTKMCRKTVLGPTYGSPIRKMMVVPQDSEDTKERFMAYITDDKIGLHILPATGNPHLAMALIAHPSGVSNLTCSFDGRYLFTAGGPDFAVHMWEINTAALAAQCKLGGEDLVPFYGLLEGGRDGELFAELEDLFYYAQLRHQGINSMETREIGNRVPLTEVPFIMRAMGFYPSEQEIEDMINEVKYEEYVNLGYYQEDIDLGKFIKLYVNHRPAFGLAPEKLLWAFKTLSESPELGKGGMIERGDFLDMLQKKGEHMTEYELAEHLTTLLGYNREGGSCEQEPFDAEMAGNYIAEALPYDINAEILVNEILGFSMTVDPLAPDDTKELIKSVAL